MSLGAAELVLEIAAAHILPTLAVEVGRFAFSRSATRPRTSRHSANLAPTTARVKRDRHLRLVHQIDTAPTRILSFTPGRVRLQIDGLRGSPKRAEGVLSCIERTRGVTSVSVSHLTGTALISYDTESIALDELLERSDLWVAVPRRRTASWASHGEPIPLPVARRSEATHWRRRGSGSKAAHGAAQLPLTGI